MALRKLSYKALAYMSAAIGMIPYVTRQQRLTCIIGWKKEELKNQGFKIVENERIRCYPYQGMPESYNNTLDKILWPITYLCWNRP
jgi:hypothetical protein